jgi:hypothetical protein
MLFRKNETQESQKHCLLKKPRVFKTYEIEPTYNNSKLVFMLI